MSLLEELKLTPGELLRQKAVRDRVTRTDFEQQTSLARSHNEAKYKMRKSTLRCTLVRFDGNQSNKIGRAGSSGSGRGEDSFNELEKRETNKE